MPRPPDGVVFQILSKTAGAPKWQLQEEYVPNIASGYGEGDAFTDAVAGFEALYGGHTGGPKEYLFVKCIEQGYEERS